MKDAIKNLQLIIALALLSSCAPFEQEDIGSAMLVAESTSLALRLKNDGQTSLRYFVIEDHAARSVGFHEYEPWTYPKLKPNERVTIPLNQVFGYGEEANLIQVFWVTETRWNEGTVIFVEL